MVDIALMLILTQTESSIRTLGRRIINFLHSFFCLLLLMLFTFSSQCLCSPFYVVQIQLNNPLSADNIRHWQSRTHFFYVYFCLFCFFCVCVCVCVFRTLMHAHLHAANTPAVCLCLCMRVWTGKVKGGGGHCFYYYDSLMTGEGYICCIFVRT